MKQKFSPKSFRELMSVLQNKDLYEIELNIGDENF